MKRILILLFTILVASSGIAQQKKVLFLGNSYTAVNDLPSMVKDLAEAGGHDLYVDKNTPGGYTLAFPSNGHLYNQTSLDKIAAENWDYVVLQEQSQYPVIEYYRNNYTFPGARELDSIIELNNNCTQTMFYMTWGRKYGGQQCINGYCSVDFVDYAHMQDSLATAYLWMSNDLGTPVAPAGMAWKKSIVEYGDPVDLFSGDGSHPSMAGSYLTACTFYTAIFHESPVGLSYTAGLDEDVVAHLQSVASETVFNYLDTWNIDTTTVASAFDYSQNSGTVSFANLSLNADEYFWDFGNGDTDTTFSPVYVYPESGTYLVKLRASSGDCKIDTSYSTIQIIISQVDVIKDDIKTLNFYPNPGKDIFYFENVDLSGVARIQIIDINGHVVYQEEMKLVAGRVEVIQNLQLKPGMYFCNIQLGDKLISGSLMVGLNNFN